MNRWTGLAIGLAALITGGSAMGGIKRCRTTACAPACAPLCNVVYKTVEKTVMVPEMRTETRTIECIEYRPEMRERICNYEVCVPHTRQVQRDVCVMVPKTEMRTVNYCVNKPVWSEVKKEVCVMVPHVEKRTCMKTVCDWTPCKETRCYKVDEGCWEERCCTTYKKVKTCCGCECVPVTCTRKVWVPKWTTKTCEVTVMKPSYRTVPHEYCVTVCKPEKRIVTQRVCHYVAEPCCREVPCTTWVRETRKQTCTETYYTSETRQRKECYTVCVPVKVKKQVCVPVCKMVEKKIQCCVAVCEPCKPGCESCGKEGCAGCDKANKCCDKCGKDCKQDCCKACYKQAGAKA